MSDEELQFCLLCAPVENALELIDRKDYEEAKDILKRILRLAQELCREEAQQEEG